MSTESKKLITRNVLKSILSSYLHQNQITLKQSDEDALCKRLLKNGFTADASINTIFKFIEQDEAFTADNLPVHEIANRYIGRMIHRIERIAPARQTISFEYCDQQDTAYVYRSTGIDVSEKTTSIRVHVLHVTASSPDLHTFNFHDISLKQFSRVLFDRLEKEKFPEDKERLIQILEQLESEYLIPKTLVIERNDGLIDAVYGNFDAELIVLDTIQNDDDELELKREDNEESLFLQEREPLSNSQECVSQILDDIKKATPTN